MGRDVPQDREEALYWLTQAAEQGNEYAQCVLGIVIPGLGGEAKPAFRLFIIRDHSQAVPVALAQLVSGHRPEVKETVRKIVDQLEQLPVVNRCYQTWWELQQEMARRLSCTSSSLDLDFCSKV